MAAKKTVKKVAKKKEETKEPTYKDQIDAFVVQNNQMETLPMILTGEAKNVVFAPTPIEDLNYIMGGGIPLGRILQILGMEASGKTSLMLLFVVVMQAYYKALKSPRGVMYIDSEHALDLNYAKGLGVLLQQEGDNENGMVISQPGSAEAALQLLDHSVHSGLFGLVILDSDASLTPQAEIEGEVGDSHVAIRERLIAQTLRKVTSTANRNGTVVCFISQMRAVINSFGNGPKKLPTGGNAIKFYSSVRLDLARTGSIKDDGIPVANSTKVKAIKNKVAPPFRETELEVRFGKGFYAEAAWLKEALEAKIIRQAGAWFSFGAIEATKKGKTELKPKNFAQGRENVLAVLDTNKPFANLVRELTQQVKTTGEIPDPLQMEIPEIA